MFLSFNAKQEFRFHDANMRLDQHIKIFQLASVHAFLNVYLCTVTIKTSLIRVYIYMYIIIQSCKRYAYKHRKKYFF